MLLYVLEEKGDILSSGFFLALLTPRSKHTHSPAREGGEIVHQTSREPSACILESVDAGLQGSSENRGCSVSISNAPWAITVYVPVSTWPGLLSSTAQRQQHLRCVFRNVFCHALVNVQKNGHRFLWNKPVQLSDGVHVSIIKTLFWQYVISCKTVCSSVWWWQQHTSEAGVHCGWRYVRNNK